MNISRVLGVLSACVSLTRDRTRLVVALLLLSFIVAGSAVAVLVRQPRGAHRQLPAGVVNANAVLRGFDAARQAAARDKQPLQTPAQHARRVRSRTAYNNLDRNAAINLSVRTFHIDKSGDRLLSTSKGVRLRRTLSRYAALVSAPKRKRYLIVSSTPVVVPTDKRHRTLLSLEMQQQGDAFAPVHPLVPISVSEHLAAGVTLPGGVTLRPAVHLQNKPPMLVGNRVFFANSARSTDFAVQPTPAGVETFWYLRSADSPERNALNFTLPHGMQLQPSGQVPGGVDINTAAGAPVWFIAPPAIHDADGTAVPGSFRISGTRLVLYVRHRAQDVRYPLEVDPLIGGIRGWYGNQNTSGQPNSGWPSSGAWQTGAYPSNPGFSFLSPATGYNGLAVTTTGAPAGYLGYWWIGAGPSSPFGTNSLGTPFTGYIWREDTIGAYGSPGSPNTDFYTEFYPHNTNGQAVYSTNGTAGATGNMVNALGGDYYTNLSPFYNVPLTFCAAGAGGADGSPTAPLCNANNAMPNNIFAMGIGALRSFSNTYAYSAILGAQVIFNDLTPPQNVTVGNAASGWVQAGPTTFTVSATQPGLGLGGFSVTNNGSQIASQSVSCPNAFQPGPDAPYSIGSQNYQSANTCPESATSQSFDLSQLAEGINTIQGHAQSITGYDTASQSVQIKIDRTAPTVDLSGSLYDSRYATLNTNAVDLMVDATDENDQGTPTSGVAERRSSSMAPMPTPLPTFTRPAAAVTAARYSTTSSSQFRAAAIGYEST